MVGILDSIGKAWAPIDQAVRDNRMETLNFGVGLLANQNQGFGPALQQGLLAAQQTHQMQVQKKQREEMQAKMQDYISKLPAEERSRFDALSDPMKQQVIANRMMQTPAKMTERQTKISELEGRGIPRNAAQDIVDGRVRIVQNPVTGETSFWNTTTGKPQNYGGVAPAHTGGQPSPAPAQGGEALTLEERKRLMDEQRQMESMLSLTEGLEGKIRDGIGPYAAISEVLDKGASIIGRRGPGRDKVAARNAMRLISKELQAAVINNPRFPVAEQEFVKRLLPNADGFLINPEAEVEKLWQLRDFMREKAGLAEQQLSGQPVQQQPQSTSQQKPITAYNPETGQRIRWNPETGQWEPL